MQFNIDETTATQRLDQFLSANLPDLSRNQIQKLILDQQVLINGSPCKKNHKLENSDIVEITLPTLAKKSPLEPIKKPLEIIYQDSNIAILNKPPFLPVHPDLKQSHKETLVNLLLGNKIPLSSLGGNLRPGIVHRLDKDTSGLIIIAKTDLGYKEVRQQFENHQVTKKYICLCIGELPSKKGLIKAPISRDSQDRKKMAVQADRSGKAALSEFKTLKKYIWKDQNVILSLLEVKIPTGRTHQIRVHFKSIGHPLLGDTTYGNSKLNKAAKGA
jgi:23S rRNA pseudouridine1911/1915/1917 synthase